MLEGLKNNAGNCTFAVGALKAFDVGGGAKRLFVLPVGLEFVHLGEDCGIIGAQTAQEDKGFDGLSGVALLNEKTRGFGQEQKSSSLFSVLGICVCVSMRNE